MSSIKDEVASSGMPATSAEEQTASVQELPAGADVVEAAKVLAVKRQKRRARKQARCAEPASCLRPHHLQTC